MKRSARARLASTLPCDSVIVEIRDICPDLRPIFPRVRAGRTLHRVAK